MIAKIVLLLSKLPFLSKIAPLFKGKIRLWIEYALIGVLITTASLTLTLWLQKAKVERDLKAAEKQRTEISKRLNSVEFVNAQQQATISALEELRKRDAKAFEDLFDDFGLQAKRDFKSRKALITLENTNAVVKEYLHNSIPPELICVLYFSCEKDNQSPSGKADSE